MARSRKASRTSRRSGIAYLVDGPFWTSVPNLIKTAATSEFLRCFSFEGRQLIQIKTVKVSQIPSALPFMDNIVRVSGDGLIGLQALQKVVNRQVGLVPGLTLKTPSWWNNTLRFGRSYSYKTGRSASAWHSPVCIAESIVNFKLCLAYWRRMTFSVRYKKILTKQISDAIDKTSTVAWAGRYKRDWQEWVGKFVGRVMAHETYHTIWALDAKTGRSWAPHLGTGNLEDEGGGSSPYRKENTVSFSNVARYRVLTQFETLRKMHSRFESYPIDRGSPSMLDIQLPQDKVKTKEWERRLKEYLE